MICTRQARNQMFPNKTAPARHQNLHTRSSSALSAPLQEGIIAKPLQTNKITIFTCAAVIHPTSQKST
jgi:hypothetical protein